MQSLSQADKEKETQIQGFCEKSGYLLTQGCGSVPERKDASVLVILCPGCTLEPPVLINWQYKEGGLIGHSVLIGTI